MTPPPCPTCQTQTEVLVASTECKTGLALLRFRCQACGAIQDALEACGPRPADGYQPVYTDTVVS